MPPAMLCASLCPLARSQWATRKTPSTMMTMDNDAFASHRAQSLRAAGSSPIGINTAPRIEAMSASAGSRQSNKTNSSRPASMSRTVDTSISSGTLVTLSDIVFGGTFVMMVRVDWRDQ